jgi:repressor LexA
LEFLKEYIEENSYPPSIREIGAATGTSSTSVVTYNLNRLEERGYISRDREVSRGLKLTHATRLRMMPEAVVQLPLLGRIVAGAPIPVPASDFPLMGDETIELTRDILGDPEGLYALEVEGSSMIDALVHDGDIVVMRHQKRVENGEMAAVWLKEREEVTLKRFYQEPGGRVRLQPANPTMQPIYVDDPRQVEVQGKVVMVIRQLQ